jgi:dTDP-4-dehydrorhamnose reductase
MNTISSTALIVGAEGGIGSALNELLLARYKAVYGTTRRSPHGENFFNIDLSNNFDELKKIAGICDVAFICAGVTKAVECENDRAGSYAVNVTNTIKLVTILQDLGLFVVWLSSNAVFSGVHPFCKLYEPYTPINEYGRQKVAAEKGILELGGRAAIVRLTKVLSKNTPPISGWIKNLREGKEIYPFFDSYFCPLSLNFSINTIAKVGCNMKKGIFHISGSDDISYADFARMLAIKLCGSDFLVKPVSRAVAQSPMLFTGRFSSLDMGREISIIDIEPQSPTQVLADIMKNKGFK